MKVVKNTYTEYTPKENAYVRANSYDWNIQVTEYDPKGGTNQMTWKLNEEQFRALTRSMRERVEKEDAEKEETETD